MKTNHTKNLLEHEAFLSEQDSISSEDSFLQEPTSFWVNAIAAILISPLFMILDTFHIGFLLASSAVALLALKFCLINIGGLLALACCWIWTLQSLIPANLMIDGSMQLNFIIVMMITLLVIKSTRYFGKPKT